MKQDPIPWLPASALTGTAMDKAIGTVLCDWAKRWFAAELSFQCCNLTSQPAEGTYEHVTFAGGHVRLSVEDMFHLGRMLSGLSGSVRWTGCDRMLLTKAARKALEDIGGVAAGDQHEQPSPMAGSPSQYTAQANAPGLRYQVADLARSWSFDLWIDHTNAIALRRRLAQAGALRPTPRIEPLRAAIAKQPVNLGAFLGAATMPVAAVRGLAEGDVIVLDRKTSDVVPVTLDMCTVSEFLVHLLRDGEIYHAKVVKPLPADVAA